MPLPSLRHPRSAIGACTTLFLTLFAAACDHSPSGPGSNSIQFSRTVSLPDAQSLLQTGPTRVEVRVIPGTLVARRVELEQSSEMTRPEQVRSRVTAVTSGTGMATFTLEVGGLQIAANGATIIRHGDRDDDAAQSALTLADFVALVQADIAAGLEPPIPCAKADCGLAAYGFRKKAPEGRKAGYRKRKAGPQRSCRGLSQALKFEKK